MRNARSLFVAVLAIAVFLGVFVSGQASAAGKKTIVVATDATWPPMEMVNTNKKIVGFDIDFLSAVAKEAGFNVEFKNTAWDGIFEGLKLGKYDAVISSVTINDERKKNFDFSLPYINAGQVLTVPQDTQRRILPCRHERQEGRSPDRDHRRHGDQEGCRSRG